MTTTPSVGAARAYQEHRGVESLENEGGQQGSRSGTEHTGLRHDAELTVKSAKEALGGVCDMAGDVYAGAKGGAVHAAGSFNQAVVKHPWTSVGVAAGVGLLLGLLLPRWRR